RRDLVVSRQETPEGPRFLLTDPHAGRTYRLRDAEYAVARRLDGTTLLAELVPVLGAELAVDGDGSTIEALVTQLKREGLLEDPSAPAPVARPADSTAPTPSFSASRPSAPTPSDPSPSAPSPSASSQSAPGLSTTPSSSTPSPSTPSSARKK